MGILVANTISPNMNLIIPTAGTEPGPTYAFDINNSLSLIDQHNHTSGQGVQVPSAGLNINSSLSFQNNTASNLMACVFTAQTSQSVLQAIYVKGVDLYYRDGNNNEIAITTGGNVNAGAGSITGLPSGTAGVAFAASVFTFSEATNTPANILVGSVLLGNNSALSKYLTLSPPNSMPASYILTLPSIPVAQSFVTLDSSGNFGTPIPYSAGITSSNIASSTITGSNIAVATITSSNMSSNIDLPGSFVQVANQNVMTSATNATHGLQVIRGTVNAAGALSAGEGFSVSRPSTGVYSITFSTSFSDTPVIIGGLSTLSGVGVFIADVTAVSNTGFTMVMYNSSSAAVNQSFSFIAMGQR
jgi:H-type lectin domain